MQPQDTKKAQRETTGHQEQAEDPATFGNTSLAPQGVNGLWTAATHSTRTGTKHSLSLSPSVFHNQKTSATL